MEQSTEGLREGIQPGAGVAWMMVGWQPSSTRPLVEVSKDKVAPRGTSAADVLVTDRDRCVAPRHVHCIQRDRCAVAVRGDPSSSSLSAGHLETNLANKK